MDGIRSEVAADSEKDNDFHANQLLELNDLQLAFVGGGIGETAV